MKFSVSINMIIQFDKDSETESKACGLHINLDPVKET